MNLIRVWGGGLTERAAFFDACDEQGILVMQDFWMSGDNNGNFGGNLTWPDAPSINYAYQVYVRAVRDTVRFLRNRPSLILWLGGS